MADYRFSLSGVALPATESLFGIWDVPSLDRTAGESEVAFDVAAPIEPTWRVQLPPDPDEAQAILEAQRRALQRSLSDLVQAQARMARIGQTEAVAFGPTAERPSSDPEARLLAAMQAIESPVSFAPEWLEQRETYQKWQAFLEQLQRTIAHYARVETQVGDALIARTAVGWTGDFDTRWEPAIPLASRRLHTENVRLALGSRIALLRLLAVVGTGATKLALRLTVPGAQLLVLPAAWQFVRDVLKELRQSWPQFQPIRR